MKILPLLFLPLLSLLPEAALAAAPAEGAVDTAIINVRIFDGNTLLADDALIISGGNIVKTGASTALKGQAPNVVDAQGKTLLPGLIDAHVHVSNPDQIAKATEWGVTTMYDMGTPHQAMKDLREHVPAFSGLAITPAGGVHDLMLKVPVLKSPAEAEAMVEDRAAGGAAFIKAIVDSPSQQGMLFLDEDILAAQVKAAHARGLKVAGHVTTNKGFDIALRQGVDILTHAPYTEVITPELAARIKAQGAVALPTLYVERAMALGQPEAQRAALGVDFIKAVQSVTALHKAGVPIVAGTDAVGEVPGLPRMPHGEALQDELALLVEAGLSPAEALSAATASAAGLFNLNDRGRIAPGMRADLLLVNGDPLADIQAARDIAGVWVGGKRIR